MRTLSLAGVLVAATLIGGLTASGSAGAAPGPSSSSGRITFCVTGGGPLSVFADGPDLRTATLTKKCKGFAVRPGQYYVGVQGYAVPDNCSTNGATVRRGAYSYRAPETLLTYVDAGRTTKVTFALDCSLPNK